MKIIRPNASRITHAQLEAFLSKVGVKFVTENRGCNYKRHRVYSGSSVYVVPGAAHLRVSATGKVAQIAQLPENFGSTKEFERDTHPTWIIEL